MEQVEEFAGRGKADLGVNEVLILIVDAYKEAQRAA